MTTAYVKLAEPDDAFQLAENMRPHDVIECKAFGVQPLRALLSPLSRGEEVFSIVEPDGLVYAMFGITNKLGNGVPWMLCSNDFPKIAIPFANRSKDFFLKLSARWPFLWNYVSADNKLAHRWLRHLGFTIGDKVTTIRGVPFLTFWKDNNVH